MNRRKALLIGINYHGQQASLQGCESDVENMTAFLISRGFSTHPRDMVIMTERRGPGPYFPTGHNILAAMDWLVSEPGCSLFLHYSGHGGQVPDPTGERSSGYEDTIVPSDYQRFGQIDSGMLHRRLVTNLAPYSSLFVVFDCCHSGSALELPWVYRTEADGRISLMDNFRAGMHLVGEAQGLIQGGFTMDKVASAQHLLAGATDFFRSLKHEFDDEGQYDGGDGLYQSSSRRDEEQRSVFMLSGCKDDQTSADAFIQGVSYCKALLVSRVGSC
jgi:metacaspase-1